MIALSELLISSSPRSDFRPHDFPNIPAEDGVLWGEEEEKEIPEL